MARAETQFSGAELLTSEALAAELIRRTDISAGLLERLSVAVNSQTLDVFTFLFTNGAANRLELEAAGFPRQTLDRVLPRLEAAGCIRKGDDFKYRAQR